MDEKLTKKERQEQRRAEAREEMDRQVKADTQKKWFIMGAIALAVIAVVGVFIYKANEPEKQLPGTAVSQLGREHVNDISGITYTSNPPTSGKHFPLWAKRGVYDKVLSDGYLIHSLEHGYIVMSYNCGTLGKPQNTLAYKPGDPLTTLVGDAAQAMAPFTPQTMPKDNKDPGPDFHTASCKQTVNNLAKFLDEFQRIVIVPRPGMDAPIVFTAWGRIQKFQKFDYDLMREFVVTFHGAGPEQTIE